MGLFDPSQFPDGDTMRNRLSPQQIDGRSLQIIDVSIVIGRGAEDDKLHTHTFNFQPVQFCRVEARGRVGGREKEEIKIQLCFNN